MEQKYKNSHVHICGQTADAAIRVNLKFLQLTHYAALNKSFALILMSYLFQRKNLFFNGFESLIFNVITSA